MLFGGAVDRCLPAVEGASGGASVGAVGGVVGGGHRLEGRLWCVWGLAVGFRYGFRRAQVQAACRLC